MIDDELSRIARQEKQLQLEEAIGSFATSARALFQEVRTRHNSINDFCPLKELQEYLLEVKNLLKDISIPEIAEPCRMFQNGRRSVIDQLVQVRFTIDLVKSTKFREFALISIPDEDQKAIKINGELLALRVAASANNDSIFFPMMESQLFPDVYAVNNFKTPSPCIRACLTAPEKVGQACEISALTVPSKEILLLREDLALIWTKNKEVSFQCGDNISKVKSNATLAKFTKCVMFDGTQYFAPTQNGSVNGTRIVSHNLSFLPPTIDIQPHHTDPRIRETIQQMEAEFATADGWLEQGMQWKNLTFALGLGAMVSLVGILTLGRHWQLKHKARQQSALEPSDRIPGFWSTGWIGKARTIDLELHDMAQIHQRPASSSTVV